jgi:hypothetical protein
MSPSSDALDDKGVKDDDVSDCDDDDDDDDDVDGEDMDTDIDDNTGDREGGVPGSELDTGETRVAAGELFAPLQARNHVAPCAELT